MTFLLRFSSEPQVICAPPEFNPDLSSMFKPGSDNPLNTIFQGNQIDISIIMGAENKHSLVYSNNNDDNDSYRIVSTFAFEVCASVRIL